jgi:hypothetical protein
LMIARAFQGTTGRRPSIPTEPAVPPGTAAAVHLGEGTDAAQPIKAHKFVRESNEHYVEPFWCSERLFEEEKFEVGIWDPCCGFGRIPDSAVKAGLIGIGTDIVDRGYRGLSGLYSFMNSDVALAPNIVGNPPFNIAGQFIRHAIGMPGIHKVAMIFPTARLNAAHWLRYTPLARVWLMTPRPSMPPGYTITAGQKPGSGKTDFCWLVFTKGRIGPASVMWLHRDPAKQTQSAPSENHDRPFGVPL